MNCNFTSLKALLAVVAGLLAATVAQAEIKPAGPGPAKVEVRQTGGRWQLFVNHQPFYIKGAGLESGDQEKLAAAGGNSFRTWRAANGQAILDRALKNGLFVTMGLDVTAERHGFNYSDPAAVAKQLAELKAQVLQFKDHPALLMWDIGNELNLEARNPAVWDAVNDISKMIHQVDPNHPTTTALAGIDKRLADEIKTRAPDLDLLCIQSYADIVNLPRELRDSGWTGPYAVTEWGATGHWECGKTAWGAPLEDDSSAKANCYRMRYETAIASDTKNCLGSYVFLWGQKQERTPTWYGMFLASGEATETVDVMQHLWTGRWPDARSPQLTGCWLDGKTAHENIRLHAGQSYLAKVAVQALDSAPLTYSWEILEESRSQSSGGDFESQPQRLSGLITTKADGIAEVKAPTKTGAYRLFAYIITANHKAAYANIPFYVDGEPGATAQR